LTTYSADLRVFGRNIQDSSLVLKGGRYNASNTLIDPVNLGATSSASGTMLGADLQLYILKSLGVEGGYMNFGASGSSAGSSVGSSAGSGQGATASGVTGGDYYAYEAFVEVAILRLMLGAYTENWRLTRQGHDVASKETGYLGGIKLQF
jgi:hypothetical protein